MMVKDSLLIHLADQGRNALIRELADVLAKQHLIFGKRNQRRWRSFLSNCFRHGLISLQVYSLQGTLHSVYSRSFRRISILSNRFLGLLLIAYRLSVTIFS